MLESRPSVRSSRVHLKACSHRALLHYVLLLTRDPSELEFVETALGRASRHDIVLIHESALGAGLSMLQACPVQLILFDPGLSDRSLQEALDALRLPSSGAPIILLGRPTGRGSGRLLIRLPRSVQAIVSRGDAAGLLRAVDGVLGPV